MYRSAEKQTRFLEPIEDYWRDKPVKSITSGAIRQSAIALYPKVSNATRNRHVIVPTQAIINHASALDLCAPIRVPRFKVETRVKNPATWEWIQAFMQVSSPHMGALACFMFLTAARVGEALKVTWQDVDLQKGRVLIKETKVGKERVAHMPAELVVAIANIPGPRHPNDTVFKYTTGCSARRVWNDVIDRSGLERLTFHSCRHGFATTLLHKGIDPVTVSKLGGWADVSQVFKTYGHAMADDTLANVLIDRNLTSNEMQNNVKNIKIK